MFYKLKHVFFRVGKEQNFKSFEEGGHLFFKEIWESFETIETSYGGKDFVT